RISRASLSMSCWARLCSACIRLRVMTVPLSCRSTDWLKRSACRISSQWLVCGKWERSFQQTAATRLPSSYLRS
ncbi:hypothetical protein GN956_G17821, partial [Arapaima gigas]